MKDYLRGEEREVNHHGLTPDEIKLARADFIGHKLIPTLACVFVAIYWILGMMKYNSPDFSAYTFLVPEFQAIYLETCILKSII